MIASVDKFRSGMGLLESIYQRMDGNPQLRRIPPPPTSNDEERELENHQVELQADNA